MVTKTKIVIVLMAVVFTSTKVYSQKLKIKEPEFADQIIYVNDSVGNGIQLEKQAAKIKTRSNAASYIPVAGLAAGKAKAKNVVDGCCSSVVINKQQKVGFIVRVKDNTVDPSTVINIFKLKQEKNERTLEVASASALGGATSNNIQYIPFSAKKYGHSYYIEIDVIQPGQYAITLPDRRDVFNLFMIE